MTNGNMTNADALTNAELAALEADLAHLGRADPVPEPSDALLARVLADAANHMPVAVAPERMARPKAQRRFDFGAAIAGFWQPVSAGLAAAALGVWLGWADPVGVNAYADILLASDSIEASDTVLDAFSLFDMEL
ncbi:MAG: hypothetical protein ACPGVA_02715 [Pikeienuella sp.]